MELARNYFNRVSDSGKYLASYQVDSAAAANMLWRWAEQVASPVVLRVGRIDLLSQIKDQLVKARVPVFMHIDVEEGQVYAAVEAGCDSVGVSEGVSEGVSDDIWQYVKDRGVWLEVDDLQGDEIGDAVRVRLPVIKGAYSGRECLLQNEWQALVARWGAKPMAVVGTNMLEERVRGRVGGSAVYRIEIGAPGLSLLMTDNKRDYEYDLAAKAVGREIQGQMRQIKRGDMV